MQSALDSELASPSEAFSNICNNVDPKLKTFISHFEARNGLSELPVRGFVVGNIAGIDPGWCQPA
jgi:hypothetical protein